MECFVIMPFSEDFSDVYATIRRAVSRIDDEEIEVLRLDDNLAAGRIFSQMTASDQPACRDADLMRLRIQG